MRKYYVTFGLDSLFRDHYLVIIAPDADTVRRVLFSLFAHHWAFIYSEPMWETTFVERGYSSNMTQLGPDFIAPTLPLEDSIAD